ncbi:hypothetical protein A2153_00265 [Candidatus Gottesmanbacteria bacterium RBG_16_38_7b]|uniref:Uncharacterized protein n=1 Tax=Candidatus Gottesmanbacteria bacterium RBG_16_38_7b TaxID=1798372 RepID=A0A1F5YEZ1_9BACT|nr:MAG: hypothetical protein A2153_00265 [Candidatus Gottesmanbacteria bacterium RBG_16_38_7b]
MYKKMTILLQTPITNPLITGFVGKKPGDAPAILAKFFSGIVGLLLIISTIWALMQLLLGAFTWISSGGDKGRIEAAQQKMLHAFMGLILVFAAWAIFLLLLRFLGISGPGDQIQLKLPTLF